MEDIRHLHSSFFCMASRSSFPCVSSACLQLVISSKKFLLCVVQQSAQPATAEQSGGQAKGGKGKGKGGKGGKGKSGGGGGEGARAAASTVSSGVKLEDVRHLSLDGLCWSFCCSYNSPCRPIPSGQSSFIVIMLGVSRGGNMWG